MLVKEPGVTEWCSPAAWVPKGDNMRVRLCTDYRELNKLVHTFPSTREILQAMNASSDEWFPDFTRRGDVEARRQQSDSSSTSFYTF